MDSTQETLFFDGDTFDGALDTGRLGNQLQAVFDTMSDGEWWTIPDLQGRVAQITNGTPTAQSISARIRDLRKERFGAWEVERKRNEAGLWWYRMTGETDVLPEGEQEDDIEVVVEYGVKLPGGKLLSYKTQKEATDAMERFSITKGLVKVTKHIKEI